MQLAERAVMSGSRSRLDNPFARLVRNATALIGGNAVQGVGALVALAITARALSPVQFGALVLASSYALVVGQLLGLQAWQAVIRYGAAYLDRDDRERLGPLVKLGFLADVAGAALAAVGGAGSVAAAAALFGWDEQSRELGYLFSVALLSNIVGTPTAILRIANRYRDFVVQSVVGVVFRLVAVSIAYALHAGLWGVAWSWVAAQVFANALLLWMSWRTLGQLGVLPLRRHRVRSALQAHRGFGEFFLSTNANSWARVLRDLDVPIIGTVLGVAAVSSFRIARQLATILYRVVDPFFQASYPEIARLCSEGNSAAALSLAKRSAVSLGLLCLPALLVFLAAGNWLIAISFGPAYLDSFAPATWCVAAAVVWAFAQPLAPLLMALGRHNGLLIVNLACTGGYLLWLIVPGAPLTVTTASVAFFAYNVAWIAANSLLALRAARAVREAEQRRISRME